LVSTEQPPIRTKTDQESPELLAPDPAQSPVSEHSLLSDLRSSALICGSSSVFAASPIGCAHFMTGSKHF
jgi:hypothetical protein